MGFIEAPNFQSVAGTSNIANFQRVAGVELDNPVSAGVNNGDIKVVSNWNLGAQDASGMPVFRTNAWHRTSLSALKTTSRSMPASPMASIRSRRSQPRCRRRLDSLSLAFSDVNGSYLTYAPYSFAIFGISFGSLPYDAVGAYLQPPAPFSSLGLANATAKDGYYGAWNAYFTEWFNQFVDTGLFLPSSRTFNAGGVTEPASVETALAAANAAYTNIGSYPPIL